VFEPASQIEPGGRLFIRPVAITFGLSYGRTHTLRRKQRSPLCSGLEGGGHTFGDRQGGRRSRPARSDGGFVEPPLDVLLGKAKGGIASLPLVELPAVPSGRLLAIIFSGDGGWRDIDKTIAQKLASDGVSVIGWDSLRYFWSRKSPEQIANDLGLVIDTYTARWGASKVALIGYSFGAGVLPFAYDRLAREAKERVVQLSLLGFTSTTDFEISIAGWLGAPASKDAAPTEPALASIDPTMIQCFYGEGESDSVCPALAGNKAEIIRAGSGHHFGGDYDALARNILAGLRRRAG
jgi:type IV secretory pathway VirJ component